MRGKPGLRRRKETGLYRWCSCGGMGLGNGDGLGVPKESLTHLPPSLRSPSPLLFSSLIFSSLLLPLLPRLLLVLDATEYTTLYFLGLWSAVVSSTLYPVPSTT